MRLDLFLKRTALIKRRTIAKEIVEKGRAFINGKIAKPSTEVKDGDCVELSLGTNIIVVKALIEMKNNKEVVNYEMVSSTKGKENA